MGILFWYIVRHYLSILLLCLTGLVTIYLVIDFFEKLRRFLKHDAELTSMLMYFVLKIPDIAFQLVPFAVLMASLLAIGLLNKNHEITAMRSCGVSLFGRRGPYHGYPVGLDGSRDSVGQCQGRVHSNRRDPEKTATAFFYQQESVALYS